MVWYGMYDELILERLKWFEDLTCMYAYMLLIYLKYHSFIHSYIHTYIHTSYIKQVLSENIEKIQKKLEKFLIMDESTHIRDNMSFKVKNR